MAIYRLRISRSAEQDLNNIYIEGYRNWGVSQAERYYDELTDHFERLRETPFLFMRVDDVREGYRRSVCGKHAIYYRVQNDTVEIMAILKRQNPFARLPEQLD